ncbi:hypothetical protein [Acinetobacter bereziniae]|uniref:Uncharacterized protein n=1 Tax=Acinetobacter bereziniae NIPH 3 TaxID=1217651 RepID=N8YWP4_ACIBZ|nr:hypothetical protein [Acinetobacter bereziniae]ENV23948.1 hypothetical protein F963_00057 [Acinetobacter bereziniae NIPH 3]
MSKSRKRTAKKFVLNQVYPYSSISSLLIALPMMLIYGIAYYSLLGDGFYLGPVSLTFLLYFATTTRIIRLFSKDVTIWFDDQYMYLQFNQKAPHKYAKQEILGFYSYDYSTKSPLLFNSKVSIHFYLDQGQKIFLNDSSYRNIVDEDKRLVLLKFLKTAQSELEFSPLHTKSRFFAHHVYWYARQHDRD